MYVLSTRKYVFICLILLTTLYLLAFAGLLRPFIVCVAVGAIVFLCTTFLYLGGLLLQLLPEQVRQHHNEHKIRYSLRLLVPVVLAVLGTMYLESIAPNQTGWLPILGTAVLAVFSLFLLWSLVRLASRKRIVITAILFSICFTLITGLSAAVKKVPHEPSREELAALPYLALTSSDTDPQKSGVTRHKPDRAYAGLNLFAPNNGAEAFLIDMNGKLVHKWTNPKSWEVWAHVTMNERGELLAIYKDHRLTKLASDSSVRWKQNGRFHHDARFAKNGDVYALSRKDELVLHHWLPVPILNDYVVLLSANGEMIEEHSLLEYLHQYVPPRKIFNIYRKLLQPKRMWGLLKRIFSGRKFLFLHTSPFDLFHTNSVEFVEAPHPLFQEGDLLISSRNISLVAVINLKDKTVKWETDQFTMQHQPSFLPNGNILVFDNGLPSTGSRIAEMEPRTKKIVWKYKADDFYAHNRGGTQRLQNGNTLITESPDGRALEVTPSGEIVWEFYTPLVREGKRSVIYRLIRFSNAEGYRFRHDNG